MIEGAISAELLAGMLTFNLVTLCIVIIAIEFPTEKSQVAYWARVHENNQSKIRQDQQDTFLKKSDNKLD